MLDMPIPERILRGRDKRTKEERERDLPVVARMYAQGHSIRDIAQYINMEREYSLGQTAIWNDIQTVRARWLDDSVDALARHKADQLSKIDAAERQAWEGWEKSKLDKEKRKKSTGIQSGKATDVETEEKEGQAGEPKFLEIILSCIDRRCKILGIDAPKKLEVTGADGGPIKTGLDVGSMSAEDVLALNAILKRSQPARKVIDVLPTAEPQQITDFGGEIVTESDGAPE